MQGKTQDIHLLLPIVHFDTFKNLITLHILYNICHMLNKKQPRMYMYVHMYVRIMYS